MPRKQRKVPHERCKKECSFQPTGYEGLQVVMADDIRDHFGDVWYARWLESLGLDGVQRPSVFIPGENGYRMCCGYFWHDFLKAKNKLDGDSTDLEGAAD
jgi:hypothetical protein